MGRFFLGPILSSGIILMVVNSAASQAVPAAAPVPDFKTLLTTKQKVIVRLDKCAGPLGGPKSTVACNHDYVVQYPDGKPNSKGYWCEEVTGINALTGKDQTKGGDCNSNPATVGTIDLFGHVLSFNGAAVNNSIFGSTSSGPTVGEFIGYPP
jgi:hypothetical protein